MRSARRAYAVSCHGLCIQFCMRALDMLKWCYRVLAPALARAFVAVAGSSTVSAMHFFTKFPCSVIFLLSSGGAAVDAESLHSLGEARGAGQPYEALAETVKEVGAKLEVRSCFSPKGPSACACLCPTAPRQGMRSKAQSCQQHWQSRLMTIRTSRVSVPLLCQLGARA